VRNVGESLKPSSSVFTAEWAGRSAHAIWRRLEARDFAGPDPYDALNAARVPSLVLKQRLGRRVLTQAVKRSPLPLQRALGVPEQADAYTLGHALLAAVRLMAADNGSQWPAACHRLQVRLRESSTRGDGWTAWGYHFPVHTRFFSYEPSTPNLIVTAFVAKGLAAATRAGVLDARDDLAGSVRFILKALPRATDASGQCFGYVPGEPAAVHNANLLAALVLCEAAELSGEEAWVAEALACARFTAARQAADGSWPYSEESYGRWIDGFHTGFVLEGLARVVRATDDAALRRTLARGIAFYVAQLFGPSGEPKYYPHRAWPLDALSAAQGVETLRVALAGAADRAVPAQLEWIRRHLVRPDGHVAYQVHRGWTDWREFPRWSSAPLMSALAGVAAGSEELR
jgi:polysaccharide biosynthesis protein VpsJ